MKTLRSGYTTGCCAAAAAKAAVMLLAGDDPGESITITLPDGSTAEFSIHEKHFAAGEAAVTIIKDAGDDPDVTNGAEIAVTAEWAPSGLTLEAGDGVGTVTLPGLQVKPGEPAINPGPRAMIESAVRQVTGRGLTVTVSVPRGAELAKKTFNEKLGIRGGISILGTTGRVTPYSCEAVRESLKCSLDIAAAVGIKNPVLVPGNIGRKAAESLLILEEHQLVQAGNDWGFMLDAAAQHRFERILVVGHPGKLGKLAEGHWDTHSARSPAVLGFVTRLAADLVDNPIGEHTTVEGLLESLNSLDRAAVATRLSEQIAKAISQRTQMDCSAVAVILVRMDGRVTGMTENTKLWSWRSA